MRFKGWTTNIFAKPSGKRLEICCLMRRKFSLWNMKVSWLGSDIISSQHPLFFQQQICINWKCKRFYIYEGYEGYIYIQVFISVFFLFQTDFLYILIVHTEKIIIYRSYFHILCFPGQRKLKNLRSLWNISKPSHWFQQKHQQTNCLFLVHILYQLCFVCWDWGLEHKI